jgi:hypothetical protein
MHKRKCHHLLLRLEDKYSFHACHWNIWNVRLSWWNFCISINTHSMNGFLQRHTSSTNSLYGGQSQIPSLPLTNIGMHWHVPFTTCSPDGHTHLPLSRSLMNPISQTQVSLSTCSYSGQTQYPSLLRMKPGRHWHCPFTWISYGGHTHSPEDLSRMKPGIQTHTPFTGASNFPAQMQLPVTGSL